MEGAMLLDYYPALPLPDAALHDPRRLATLGRTDLLDSPPSEVFDRFTRLAVTILRVPVALITLVDADRQFFLSSVGLPAPWDSLRQTPLSHSFCQYVVASGAPLLVADARRQPRLKDNAAIVDLGVVAYAGFPLRTYEGVVLGSFCVIGRRPRVWRPREVAIVYDVAAAVTTDIELRLCR